MWIITTTSGTSKGNDDAVKASDRECTNAAESAMGTLGVPDQTHPRENEDNDVEDLETEASLRAASSSQLYNAACENDVAVLEKLLCKNASLDWQNADGHTPLTKAVIDKNTAAVVLLLEHRAGVNVADKDNRTALIYAALSGDSGMMRTLIKVRASFFSGRRVQHDCT